ncbi:MAG: nitroreductase [Actinobacteria bacterium]|nr:nitroreductase [Actinomycetota bacterium]
METNSKIKKNAVCNTCTLKLVAIAYRKKPVFRLFREPLKMVMRILSWIYRVNPDEYQVRTPSCRGCIRFYKLTLKERSGIFRWLNNRINPLFDRVLESIVTEEELKIAKEYGKNAINGEVSTTETDKWMKDLKTG